MIGFLNIYKPTNMTSFEVIKRLKRKLPGVKFGHLGTLDPMAEGVLPVAAGSATRIIEYITNKTKTYRTVMVLGGTSDTQDAWGNISYHRDIEPDLDRLPEILQKYTGNIEQVPPMYSAVHHNGQRLYDLARKGIVVERKSRTAVINRLELINLEADEKQPVTLELLVDCAEGTYIRTLCHDIGYELGGGAFMSALVRLRWGVFTQEDAVALEDLLAMDPSNIDHVVKPVDYPLQDIPYIKLSDKNDIQKINNGNFIIADVSPGTIYRIYDDKNRLLSMARGSITDNRHIIKPLKVI